MGLSSALSITNEALQAQQTALETTANNIANVNTPGYTRQVTQLAEQAPFAGTSGVGGGVGVEQIQSIRDSVLELRLNQENQTQTSLTAMQQQLGPVEALFSTSGGAGLGTAIDNFFNSLQQLSTDPTSGAARQSAITAAQTLTQTFNQVAGSVQQQQLGADQQVVQDVSQANSYLSQIAALNGQIASAQNSHQNTGPLIDQRTTAIRSLSGLMSFYVSNGSNGQVTLTTGAGSQLVVGTDATSLSTQPNGSGLHQILAGGTDITSSLTGGALAGLVQARDQTLPQLSSQLDQLASGIASAVNSQNALGYTPSGAAGGNIFTPPPATGAASVMSMATTDPNAIATSGDGTPGDNSNLLKLAGVQQQAVSGGLTPDNAYASIVSSIGSVISGVNTQQQASSVVLTQLQNQRDAISGVSLDQESIALNQFQQAFNAAARVVTVVNTLTSLAINLGKD